MLNLNKKTWMTVMAGVAVGIAALVLTAMGNPPNMGFCIACFERDIAGAIGLHGAEKVQYLRPEIAGLVIGAFIMALVRREFKPKSGSSPVTRFILGAVVMTGALVFLGCPLRMVLRLGGGDVNAVFGLLGFVAGIIIGILFLNRGFDLKRAYPSTLTEGIAFPALLVVMMAAGFIAPAIFRSSETGPGSMHANTLIALAIAAAVGALLQRTRLCMVGGIRDIIMFKDASLLSGFAALFATVLVGNLIMGKFNPGMASQPIAHSSELWNALGMVLVGWGSVLLGGCPMRQLILAGEGNTDSAITVLGMVAGAASAHNFSLAGNPDSISEAGELIVGGIGTAGKIAVAIGAAVLLAVSVLNTRKKENAK